MAIDENKRPARALPSCLAQLKGVVVVCGHYGVGKTNFALNLAIDAAALARKVCLVDLDVVNPYFRSSDYTALLEASGVGVVAPQMAGTALDAPMLSGRIGTEIARAREDEDCMVIIDAGGDDAGATALGSFSETIAQGSYHMLYLINALREQTLEPRQAAELLGPIELQAKLKASALVNNTHLHHLTEIGHIEQGLNFSHEVSSMVGLPLWCTTCPVRLEHSVNSAPWDQESFYFVQTYVTTPWETDRLEVALQDE